MAWTTPRTWVAGEVVTAALLNTHLRDNLNALGSTWTSYTPSWTSTGTAPALGDGTIAGRYLQVGKLVIGSVELTMGSTTTYGTGTYQWSVPVTAANSAMSCGSARLVDGSTNHAGVTVMWTTTTVAVIAAAGGMTTNTNPFTWASGDDLYLDFVYEAA